MEPFACFGLYKRNPCLAGMPGWGERLTLAAGIEWTGPRLPTRRPGQGPGLPLFLSVPLGGSSLRLSIFVRHRRYGHSAQRGIVGRDGDQKQQLFSLTFFDRVPRASGVTQAWQDLRERR